MTGKDYLPYCITLSQYIVAAAGSVQHILMHLSQETLSYILLITYVVFFVALVFRFQTRGQISYKLWFISVPAWIPPTILCLLLAALLLL